jgi:hypothetical protein
MKLKSNTAFALYIVEIILLFAVIFSACFFSLFVDGSLSMRILCSSVVSLAIVKLLLYFI